MESTAEGAEEVDILSIAIDLMGLDSLRRNQTFINVEQKLRRRL